MSHVPEDERSSQLVGLLLQGARTKRVSLSEEEIAELHEELAALKGSKQRAKESTRRPGGIHESCGSEPDFTINACSALMIQ
jgi:hypothetical protein